MKKGLTVIFTGVLMLNSFIAHATNFNNGKFDVFCVLPTQKQNFTEHYEGVSNISTNPAGSKESVPAIYFIDKDGRDVYLEGYYCTLTSVIGNSK